MKKGKYYIVSILLIIVVGFLTYFLLSDKKVKITSITMNEKNISIFVDDYEKIGIIIVPLEASIDNLLWESSDDNIVSVINDGIIVGNNAGEAIITVKLKDKEISDSCLVQVLKKEANQLEIVNKDIEMIIDTTQKLDIIIDPIELEEDVTWISSDESVVMVDSKGMITANKKGNAIIKAVYGDMETTCNVKVNEKETGAKTESIPVKEIKLNKYSLSLKKNKSETLTATIVPSNATNKKIVWTSSNEKIVKVDSNGKVTGVGTGTALIEAKIDGVKASCLVQSTGYIITEDQKFSKLNTIASYNSSTLKYSIKRNNGDYVLIWVDDANKQLNSAIPEFGNAFSAEDLLDREIKKYGYQKKGLVAVNASYFKEGWDNTPGIPFVINKGNILRNIENINYNRTVYNTLGVTKDGMLKTYKFSKDDYNKNLSSKLELQNDGVRNDFAFTLTIINKKGKVSSDNGKDNRTIICQVDENNFVLYSGGSLTFNEIGNELKNTYGCKTAYNLDGGGSRKLYYKTSAMSKPEKIFGGSRAIPDMLYFVEK